jgi:hypothetical protein
VILFPGWTLLGLLNWRWRRDLNPRTVLAVSRFQGECIRPLCHATVDKGNGGPGCHRRPDFADRAVGFSAALIRRQFSPIAAICERDRRRRKYVRTPSA